MNEIENILKRVRDTKALEFGVGAMKKIPAMFDSLFPGKTAVVVADKITYEIAGKTIHGYLEDAGIQAVAPYEPEMIGVSREKLRKTFRAIPFMRDRFTGIDLIYRAGIMDEVEAYLFGKGGIYGC